MTRNATELMNAACKFTSLDELQQLMVEAENLVRATTAWRHIKYGHPHMAIGCIFNEPDMRIHVLTMSAYKPKLRTVIYSWPLAEFLTKFEEMDL